MHDNDAYITLDKRCSLQQRGVNKRVECSLNVGAAFCYMYEMLKLESLF